MGTALLAGGISFVTLLFIRYRLPESLPEEDRRKVSLMDAWRENNVMVKIGSFMRDSYISHLFIVIFVFAFVFNAFTTIYLRYAKDILQANLFYGSALGTLIGVFFAFNQAVVLRKMARYLKDIKLILFGLIFLLVGL